MKNTKLVLISALLLTSFNALSGWENPAVLCPEESLPKGVTCLNLENVKNPFVDFPLGMSEEEKKRWNTEWSKDLILCRSTEALRREEMYPGSFTPLQIQLSWMTVDGGKKTTEKLQAILNSSQKLQIPPQVLVGALIQESLMATLGIAEDGGNFSCGMAQLNIQEWCESLKTLSLSDRERLGWPQIACAQLNSSLMSPFYEIAVGRLQGRPEYRLTSTDFSGITLNEILPQWPADTAANQALKFKAVNSFINNCQDVNLGISFKAQTLKRLFSQFVPAPLRNAETYSPGQTFSRRCQTSYSTKYYPLHTGWLLAVAMYNAGPAQSKLLEHYFRINPSEYPALNPLDLIEALHWGGVVKEGTRRVYFEDFSGKSYSQSWYKSCVVQRHVARVIQKVSQPGNTLARSLEQVACAQAVPHYRQISSGVKTQLHSLKE